MNLMQIRTRQITQIYRNAGIRAGTRQIRSYLWSVLAAGTVAAVVMIALPPGVTAQPTLPPASADDLRPLYATGLDFADGKRLAEATCARCHGLNGISVVAGVPNLAGQRAPYLYRELQGYQSGVRNDENMNNSVKFLSKEALVDVAAYYAGLDPPPPQNSAEPAPENPVEAGKAAAAGCAGCHGPTGASKLPGTPNLSGLDPQYLVAAMKAYKSDQRKSQIMKPLLAAISDTQMNNIALYFGLQKPERTSTPAQGDAQAGEPIAVACAGCHGAGGVSTNPVMPSLAGQDPLYVAAALQGYKDGTRNDATMKGVVASLNDAATKNVAAYFAAQQPQAPNVRKPLTVVEWAERCDRCHGVNGNSTDPRIPALAGQHAGYLEKVLRAYQDGSRQSPEMSVMAKVLGDADVTKLAAHYSDQKARAVVYIPIPAR